MIADKIVYCDFCNAEVSEQDCYANKKGNWSVGQQGFVSYFGLSGCVTHKVKHACPNEICQAKLLAWSHS